MNVLVFTRELPPNGGGAGSYSKNIAIGLSREGCRVTVLTTSMPEKRAEEIVEDDTFHLEHDVDVIRSNYFPKIYLFLMAVRLLVHLSCNKYDSILIADSGAQKALSFINNFVNVPYWVVFHGSELNNFFIKKSRIFSLLGGERRIKNMLLHSKGCIAVSKYLERQIVKFIPEISDKLHIITHGIDVSRFVPTDNSDAIKAKYNLPLDKKIILSASRLMVEKGQDVLIKCFSNIVINNNIILVIVGNGPHKDKLINLVNELNLTDKVLFAGALTQSRLIEYYQACDIFVQLSRIETEAFGLVYLEANACEKVVVGLDCGGVAEAIENGYSGVLLNKYSDDLSNQLIGLLNDDTLRKQMAKNGLKRVREGYSVKSMAIKTLTMMQLSSKCNE